MISHSCIGVSGLGRAHMFYARIRRKPAHRGSFTFVDE